MGVRAQPVWLGCQAEVVAGVGTRDKESVGYTATSLGKKVSSPTPSLLNGKLT